MIWKVMRWQNGGQKDWDETVSSDLHSLDLQKKKKIFHPKFKFLQEVTLYWVMAQFVFNVNVADKSVIRRIPLGEIWVI